MPTNTTTYSFQKPVVGGDEGDWGTYLNANWDSVDDLLDGTTPISPNLTEGSWQVGGTTIAATAAEINRLDGVSSNIQTQLDSKIDNPSGTDIVINGVTVGRGGNTSNVILQGGTTGIHGGLLGVIIGEDAGASLTSNAYWNTAVGANALENEADSNNNTAIGQGALQGTIVTGGAGNTCVGKNSGKNGSSGNYNTAVGTYALQGNATTGVTGGVNVGVGYYAGTQISSGSGNVGIGSFALQSVTTGNNNIGIGEDAGWGLSPFTITTQSNRIVMGNNSTTNAYIAVSWTVTSDERDKADFSPITSGLEAVCQFEPYTFKFDRRSNYYVRNEDGEVIEKPTPDGTHKTSEFYAGFKAQQVKQVLDGMNFPQNIIVDEEDAENLKIKETAIIPLLVDAIKELKQRVEVLEAGA